MAHKKSFIKIKEKIVSQDNFKSKNKNWFSIIFLIFLFLLVGTMGLFFYYFLPRFFQDKPAKIVEVEVEKKIPFIPERIISLNSEIDFPIISGTVSAILKTKINQRIDLGDEILILGNGMYKKYSVTETEITAATPSGKIFVENEILEINFPVSYKPPKSLLLKAEIMK